MFVQSDCSSITSFIVLELLSTWESWKQDKIARVSFDKDEYLCFTFYYYFCSQKLGVLISKISFHIDERRWAIAMNASGLAQISFMRLNGRKDL